MLLCEVDDEAHPLSEEYFHVSFPIIPLSAFFYRLHHLITLFWKHIHVYEISFNWVFMVPTVSVDKRGSNSVDDEDFDFGPLMLHVWTAEHYK